MTPLEEKARELVEMFQDITALKVTLDEFTTVAEIRNHAKQCALICVDEIIKTGMLIDEGFEESETENGMAKEYYYEYWQRIKKEIENL